MKKVVLAIGAHPDDMDFGASGTVAKLVEEGWDAYYLICTDGSRGSSDPAMTHKRLAKIRSEEQRAAGKILGLKDIFFLNHTDTQLVADLQLKEEIVRVIRTVRPQVVITFDPTYVYSTKLSPITNTNSVNHTDHRAAGQAAIDAVFPMSRDRLTFPDQVKEGLTPHRVEELWLINPNHTDYIVDITSTFDKKLEALAAHISQFEDFPTIKRQMTERAIAFAKEEAFTFAENFVRLTMP